MKSINGINWKTNNIPERLILKNKQNFKISYLLSKIFLDKNYTDEEIYNSINKLKNYEFNYQNKDFSAAGKFILDCFKNKKKILIFGDYDVDGYSSTYLLYDFFSKLRINCDYYIPERLTDGYGPNIKLLKKLINKNNYNLVIFVDCASNSIEEINFLENNGLKIIIIDHHKIQQKEKFKNTVIINPLKNPVENKYFFCATTLVFFFIKYLSNYLKITKKIDFNKYLFFAGMATICDQVPLAMYNKIIVNSALNIFNSIKSNRLKKLVNLKSKITSNDIGFILGPIINSAGRLGFSDLPFKLLIENKKSNIEKIQYQLINLNEKRKNIQKKTIRLLKNNNELKSNEVIFEFKKNINEGLLGIIAANYVELYNRPSFILTNSGNLIKCSSRSINGYDIGNIFYLAIQKKIIINGGGHSMAGGCTLKKEKLDDFKKFLNMIYIKQFNNFENIKTYIGEQNFNSLKTFAKYDLQNLQPFGNNNINPFFLIKNNKILKIKIIKDTNLQLIIVNRNKRSCVCYAFNAIDTILGDCLMNVKKEVDLIVQINNKNIQKNTDFNLIIKDAIV